MLPTLVRTTPLSMQTIRPRPYAGLHDLVKMKALVMTGRRQSPHSGYPHTGDLDWWLFYGAQGDDHSRMVTLWETTEGDLIGWVYFDYRRCEFDLVVLPNVRGGAWEAEITLRAEEQLGPVARASGRPIRTFAWSDDTDRQERLENQGYVGEDFLTYFAQPLNVPLPEAWLPDGFMFLDQMHEKDAERRADVHFQAFSPSKMTPDRYRAFMRAPGYDPSLDVVVVAPDGRFAAFAMGWIDPLNRISVFEPVGTRPDMQRRGLGKAALLEGMRRLQARGMVTATVCAESRNAGNLDFYRSAGFYRVNTILRYQKPAG